MLARALRALRAARSCLLGQLALSPDLKHLDDGACRWRFGDDPTDIETEEW